MGAERGLTVRVSAPEAVLELCITEHIFWPVFVCPHMYIYPHLCLSVQIDRGIWLLLSIPSGQGEEGEVGRGRGIGNELSGICSSTLLSNHPQCTNSDLGLA